MKISTMFMISLLLWVSIATLGRLIPHPANATPLASLAILSAVILRKHWAIILTGISLLISDALLTWYTHTNMWGSWTFFMYTGYLGIALAVPHTHRLSLLGGYAMLATIAYWLWTNLGVWLEGVIYPMSNAGFMQCYIAALPFLRNALLGNLIYLGVFWFALQQLSLNGKMSVSLIERN